MGRVLFVEPEKYPELEAKLQEEGIDYDRASSMEAQELFDRVGYDGVVGPEDRDLYESAVDEGVPFLAFETFSRNFTDSLSQVPDVDAQRIDHYLDEKGLNEKDYIEMLTHDIRNKVQVIEGYSGLVREDPDKQEYWEIIEENLNSVKGLLDTTEVFSSIENGDREERSLNTALEAAVDEYEREAVEKKFDLYLEADDSYTVSTGPLLQNMYGQLIENSLKHSGGEKIKISVTGNESAARVDVEDDGKGVPEELRSDILEKGTINGDSGNTGIGMFIVSKIADSYDINLNVGESEEFGGARFTTFVPKSDQN